MISSDDAEQGGGTTDVSSSDLELIQDGSINQIVGLRWTSLAIPPGSTITNAYVQFSAKEAQTEATNLVIQGHAVDNAPTFQSPDGNVSTRPRTSASASWAPPAWSSGQSTTAQRTPDLKNIIQQIVSRPGWVSGNSLALIISGTGHRTAWSFNGNASLAPLLHVELLSNTPPANDGPPVARLSVAQAPSPALTVTADASASTDTDATPIASYRFTWGDGTSATTVNAPTATANHTYAAAGTYTVTLIVTDTGGKTSATVTASVTVTTSNPTNSTTAVYVGYYDTHHTSQAKPKPNPWRGATNVTFVGTPDPGTSNGWDTSCIRIDNLSASSVSVSVTVNMGSKNFALWGTQTIASGRTLILAQTGFENFDGSDTSPAGCYSCNPNMCLTQVSSVRPVVRVTSGGTTTNYIDTQQIMNTKGVDGAGCPYTGTRNDESSNWVRVFPAAAAAGQTAATDEVRAALNPVHEFSLAPLSPNPNHGDLDFEFTIPQRSPVRLGIYDLMGRLVKSYVDEVLDPGFYRGQFKLQLAAGVYFFRVSTSEGTLNRRFVLVR